MLFTTLMNEIAKENRGKAKPFYKGNHRLKQITKECSFDDDVVVNTEKELQDNINILNEVSKKITINLKESKNSNIVVRIEININ